ncbi:MAG: hypothetical protein RML47_09040 [Bacteroidota bacterium]|nr:hypothetical protein [Rhodothermia bacterium]MDW8286225.1 hypothetical protein [Bacteroidota bacterium]
MRKSLGFYRIDPQAVHLAPVAPEEAVRANRLDGNGSNLAFFIVLPCTRTIREDFARMHKIYREICPNVGRFYWQEEAGTGKMALYAFLLDTGPIPAAWLSMTKCVQLALLSAVSPCN